MLTVSNDLLMSSATVNVRSGGLFWLKPVAMCYLCCVVHYFQCYINNFYKSKYTHQYYIMDVCNYSND